MSTHAATNNASIFVKVEEVKQGPTTQLFAQPFMISYNWLIISILFTPMLQDLHGTK